MIHLDFETFSEQDLRAVGQYRYAMDQSTEVLIACYAFDDGPIYTWLPHEQEEMPVDLRARARVDEICAHNASFESAIWDFVCVSKHNAPILRPQQWVCTAARASMCGLPRGLDAAAKAMHLQQGKDYGGEFIRMFCMLQRDGSRITPDDRPEEFKRFVRYCRQDVRAERGLHEKLPALPDFERRVFALDHLVNSRGLPIDTPLVKRALKVVSELENRVQKRVRKITKGINPTQRDKILAFLSDNGVELDNLQAQTVRGVLAATHLKIPANIRELLELRVEAARVSTKKLTSMLRVAMLDRMRGIFLYYGAHTGRWSGKLVQPHNFIRGLLSLTEQTRVFDMLKKADADIFEMVFKWPLSTISQCMRGFISPPEGYRFVIVDYSAIERRVAAWIAREKWVLNAYAEGKDLYVLLASLIWGIPEEEVSDEQRRIAKNIELGCIYQMSGKKFVIYCAKQGIEIEEKFGIDAVDTFRERNPRTVKMWWRVEEAAIEAVLHPKRRIQVNNLSFFMEGDFLCIELPSGRCLYYPFPKVEVTERYGKPKPQLSYRTDWKGGKWMRISTYGGKIFENIVQAVSRDFMAHGMLKAEEAGYKLVGTVHDELIAEMQNGKGSADEMAKIVCEMPEWGEGCPLTSKGFEADRYRKG